jgi:HME family heavy-metal exporter
MLNTVIRQALQHRLVVIVLAIILMVCGTWQALVLPVDVFPDLNRPRVTIMTEALGLAPEEVETLITFPIETAMNGANGVETVRSSSGVGLSVINVEFAWGTDIYQDRQIVNERLQVIQDRLPAGTNPQLAPISSIMGQILVLGMWCENDQTTPMEMRTLADWVIRQRLLTIQGVSQIFTMGGGRKQFQVLVDPYNLSRLGVTMDQIREALLNSNQNAAGGYLDQQGPQELLVRSLGRIQSVEDLSQVVITFRDGQPLVLSQVAEVKEAAQVKRGDGSAFVRNQTSTDKSTDKSAFSGGPAVVLTIGKQPGADTRKVTLEIEKALRDLLPSLPAGIRIESLYTQKTFIDRAIANVEEALRDGGILVVIILWIFLLNFRTTFITLTAIPLSLVITAIVFKWLGMNINTMTLGGLAVAIGELVDDAIVDVENIFRRLKENSHLAQPLPKLQVIYNASSEIRNSIVFGTMIVILAFIPLMALEGMEGKLFAPLGYAYIISILASLLVSLTVTPVLSSFLLSGRIAEHSGDSFIQTFLKAITKRAIQFSLYFPRFVLGSVLAMVIIAGWFMFHLERDFLPPFNEGSIQLNVILPPGTSLKTSLEVNQTVERELQSIDDVLRFVRRTGRAELDEHAEGVNASEYILELDPASPRSREEQLREIREKMEDIPEIVSAVEQPMAHLISHMLSGVKAQIGIKIYGDDLQTLRAQAEGMKATIAQVAGVKDLMIEQQIEIPQLRIELQPHLLKQYGLHSRDVNQLISTAMNGEVLSQILLDQRSFDLVLKLDEKHRENLSTISRLTINLPDGGTIPLSAVANIYESSGPNTINREDVRRRIVLQCNVEHRGVVDVVQEIQKKMKPIIAELPTGYFVEYSGQFESQQSASRMIGILFLVSLGGIFMVLYTMFGSVNLSLQVMSAIPMSFVGSVAAIVLTGQSLTIASMVGFISLAGIASRNGILLVSHYLHLVKYENEQFTQHMIIRAGLERLTPVLMTALTSGIGLVPLVLSADDPGKEILYPVATVVLGGLISSTLLDFLVHPALFWLFGMNAASKLIQPLEETLVTKNHD